MQAYSACYKHTRMIVNAYRSTLCHWPPPSGSPTPIHLLLAHPLQCLHLTEVPPAQSDPASTPMGVIHLLNRNPVFWLSVWGYGDAVLPA